MSHRESRFEQWIIGNVAHLKPSLQTMDGRDGGDVSVVEGLLDANTNPCVRLNVGIIDVEPIGACTWRVQLKLYSYSDEQRGSAVLAFQSELLLASEPGP
ncbi:MAG: hypothetical protein ACOC1F_00450 [Myxococcota bacterium]